jgi:hypothetical protein
MGFALKAFVTGAAGALSEKLDQDEKTAQESAKIVTSRLTNRMIERNKEIEEKVNGQSKTIDALKAYAPFTEAQLYAIARNPLVAEETLSAFKEGRVDAARFNPETFVKMADSVPDKRTAKERIREEYSKQELGSVPAIPADAGFLSSRAARIQQQEVAKIAAAYGTTPEQLYGAAKPLRAPEANDGATFDMAQVAKARTLEQQRSQVVSDLMKAKESGNEDAIAKAMEGASRLRISEDLAGVSNKSENQIQSDLITKIQSAKDPAQKTILTAELRQRQTLSKLPGEGQEKVSQSNLITVASKAVTAAVSDRLPPGSFVITTDAQGNQSLAPKDIVSAKTFNEAVTAGRTAVIKEMTGGDGKPRDQLHRNALISIGVGFDDNGRAIMPTTGGKPEIPAPVAPAAPVAATPAPAKPATTAQPTTAKALPYTPEGAPDKGKLVKGQAYDDGNGNVKTWTGMGWANK